MRGSRALVAVAATGLSAALALGAVASASASPTSPSTPATVGVRQPAKVPAKGPVPAKAPFPGKKPAAILALSLKSAKAASSVHVRASSVDKNGVTKVDLIIGRLGGRGVIAAPGGTVQVIRVKQTVYVNGDVNYWRTFGVTDAQAKVVAGKWIGLKGNGPVVKEMLTLTSLTSWTTHLATLKPTARVAGKVITRIPTVGLQAPGGTLYIAATGTPFPLLATDPADARNAEAFSEWNKRVTFKAPKALMVISS